MAQQIIYVEGLGFIPISEGQTPQEAIALAKQAREGRVGAGMGASTPAAAPAVADPAAEPEGSALQSTLGAAKDLALGAGKGLGESVFNLGALMKDAPTDLLVPGLSSVTSMKTLGDVANRIGPQGTNADQAFAQTPPELEAEGGWQQGGKLLEQLAEFFIPSGKVGPLAHGAANLVTGTSKASGPVRRAVSDAAWKLAPAGDEAIGAGAVALAHGDENPQHAMLGSAGGNLVGQAAAQGTKLLRSDVAQQIASLLAATSAGNIASALGADAFNSGASGLGTYAVTRGLARRALRNPAQLQWMLEELGRRGGALSAGVVDAIRANRPMEPVPSHESSNVGGRQMPRRRGQQ